MDLQQVLEDTQSALASALARIEALRIRERQLIDEVSSLRKQVHGGAPAGPSATVAQASPAVSADKVAIAAKELSAMSTCSITIPTAQEPQFTSLTGDAPLYVASLDDTDHAVCLWVQGDSDAEKIPCQLLLNKEWIDFVQVRARVKADEFIGITTVKEPRVKASSGLLCCFGGEPQPKKASSREESPAPSSGGGDVEDASKYIRTSVGPLATEKYRIFTSGREQKPVEFEASHVTRATLHKHTQRWLGQEDETGDEAIKAAEAEAASLPVKPRLKSNTEVVPPKHLTPVPTPLRLVGTPSQILNQEHVAALSSAVPPLERMRNWSLSYSTKVHGISLSTLYRKVSSGQIPTLTIVKDSGGHVFGCYTSEGWRIAPRYYGTGESFVFQLEPFRLMWNWVSASKEKNDFFQYSTPECLAIGGAGHFALHVDQELLQGSSGVCGTFGSPCLSAREDFKLMCLEVWQVSG